MEQVRGARDGAKAVSALAVAVGGFGVWFGFLADTSGMGSVAPIVMSATSFAGSAQFAATSVLGAGGAVSTAVVAALLLNARYLPIGVTVAPYLEGGFWNRLLHAHLTVDETWAVAAEGHGRWNPKVLFGAGVVLWLAWVAGTAIGVTFGYLIGDPTRLGLDAAFPALFLALLRPQLDSPTAKLAALLGAAIGLALTPFTPAGVPIVAASLACLLGLRKGAK